MCGTQSIRIIYYWCCCFWRWCCWCRYCIAFLFAVATIFQCSLMCMGQMIWAELAIPPAKEHGRAHSININAQKIIQYHRHYQHSVQLVNSLRRSYVLKFVTSIIVIIIFLFFCVFVSLSLSRFLLFFLVLFHCFWKIAREPLTPLAFAPTPVYVCIRDDY